MINSGNIVTFLMSLFLLHAGNQGNSYFWKVKKPKSNLNFCFSCDFLDSTRAQANLTSIEPALLKGYLSIGEIILTIFLTICFIVLFCCCIICVKINHLVIFQAVFCQKCPCQKKKESTDLDLEMNVRQLNELPGLVNSNYEPFENDLSAEELWINVYKLKAMSQLFKVPQLTNHFQKVHNWNCQGLGVHSAVAHSFPSPNSLTLFSSDRHISDQRQLGK